MYPLVSSLYPSFNFLVSSWYPSHIRLVFSSNPLRISLVSPCIPSYSPRTPLVFPHILLVSLLYLSCIFLLSSSYPSHIRLVSLYPSRILLVSPRISLVSSSYPFRILITSSYLPLDQCFFKIIILSQFLHFQKSERSYLQNGKNVKSPLANVCLKWVIIIITIFFKIIEFLFTNKWLTLIFKLSYTWFWCVLVHYSSLGVMWGGLLIPQNRILTVSWEFFIQLTHLFMCIAGGKLTTCPKTTIVPIKIPLFFVHSVYYKSFKPNKQLHAPLEYKQAWCNNQLVVWSSIGSPSRQQGQQQQQQLAETCQLHCCSTPGLSHSSLQMHHRFYYR